MKGKKKEDLECIPSEQLGRTLDQNQLSCLPCKSYSLWYQLGIPVDSSTNVQYYCYPEKCLNKYNIIILL